MELNNIVINRKFKITNNIVQGKFGNIFKCTHIKTNEYFAIKIENKSNTIKLLKNETTMINYLYGNGCRNIPSVIWYGNHNDHLCLIMPLYDCSLYDYIMKKTLSISQINNIILQCINIISSVHTNFVIHRDIKPQNFMIKNGELFLIDFGFSTFYVNQDKQHYSIDCSINNIIGTPKYISIHIHNGILYSRRDDIISIGYIYIFLLYKELTWDSYNYFLDDNSNLYDELHILHYKNQMRKHLKTLEYLETIFKTKNFELYNFLNYCYSIEFYEEPNYDHIISLLSVK